MYQHIIEQKSRWFIRYKICMVYSRDGQERS